MCHFTYLLEFPPVEGILLFSETSPPGEGNPSIRGGRLYVLKYMSLGVGPTGFVPKFQPKTR